MTTEIETSTKRLLAFEGARELSEEELDSVSGGMKWTCKSKGTWSQNGGNDAEVSCEISG